MGHSFPAVIVRLWSTSVLWPSYRKWFTSTTYNAYHLGRRSMRDRTVSHCMLEGFALLYTAATFCEVSFMLKVMSGTVAQVTCRCNSPSGQQQADVQVPHGLRCATS